VTPYSEHHTVLLFSHLEPAQTSPPPFRYL